MHIVFTTLALNQTHYFLALCQELEKRGFSTSIISFHEESVEVIKSGNIRVFNIFDGVRSYESQNLDVSLEFGLILEKYAIDSPNVLLSHEKIAFGLTHSSDLQKKFVFYFKSLEPIFSQLHQENNGNVVLFQELGGFASLISSFYVAKLFGIDNVFMEPSFFKGRMSLIRNSFQSLRVEEEGCPQYPEVSDYLSKAKQSRMIVIPKKDAHYYNHPIRKILNLYNLKRLGQKLSAKYLRGQKEEFNHIWSYILRHLRMLKNRLLLSALYQPLPQENFIYYPFHVPMDVSLTVRAPLFVDQIYLIDYVARSIPFGYRLVIKEHPAMIGAISAKGLKELLKRNDNVVLVSPDINNHEVMSRMDLLVTVNSKTGAESLMLGKKVICLGDAFYNQSKCVQHIPNLAELLPAIKQTLKAPLPQESDITAFFNATFRATYAGELYFCERENIVECSDSILQFLKTPHAKA